MRICFVVSTLMSVFANVSDPELEDIHEIPEDDSALNARRARYAAGAMPLARHGD